MAENEEDPSVEERVDRSVRRLLVMIWLVFFPPAFYQRWIQRATPAAKAVEG